MGHPDRVIVAGDWHGHTNWAKNIVDEAARVECDTIVHLGDFGYWAHTENGRRYLKRLSKHAVEREVTLFFVDGNHENHEMLHHGSPDQLEQIRTNIYHIPRGFRWTWHDRAWIGIGGAVSVDQNIRVQGRDWWPQEELTAFEFRRILNSGPADVVVAHDCPIEVPLTLPETTVYHPDLIEKARKYQENMSHLAEFLYPKYWFHGHYHDYRGSAQEFMVQLPGVNGRTRVTGFEREGHPLNIRLLDVRTMEWK
jgi:Calcineurin-like phosphoesterase